VCPDKIVQKRDGDVNTESRLLLGPAMKGSSRQDDTDLKSVIGARFKRPTEIAIGNILHEPPAGTFRREKSMAVRCGLTSICAPAYGVEKKDACILAFTRGGRLRSGNCLTACSSYRVAPCNCTVTFLYCIVTSELPTRCVAFTSMLRLIPR
jgi:hypothetical protein